jgi:hypothetical protein
MASKLKQVEVYGHTQQYYYCPGCKQAHNVNTAVPAGSNNPAWTFDGDPQSPTFTPSVLVTWSEPKNINDPQAMERDLALAKARRDAGEQNIKLPSVNKVCHHYVTLGRIQYLLDSTHELAGHTVDMVDWQTRPLNILD